ncbi:hypothetical protein ABEF86_16195 (plasmid) [Acinetobacter thermotolerans]|uniref:hypothetical protein n=1 Tax=Acinetobacter thermotolerans TaxID=3151487 RepID=UPI00325ABD86
MRITRIATSETVQLEDGFFWSDEFDWQSKEQSVEYAIDGTPHIQEGIKLGARPITLVPADTSMGWAKLSAVRTLREWSTLSEEFRLKFELPHDSREFDVVFNHTSAPLEASYVKGIPPTSLDDFLNLTLRFWSA